MITDEEFVCLRKKRFDSEAEAKTKALKSREITGEDWSAYKCRYCGGFHIGHTPTSKRNRKEQRRRNRIRRLMRMRNGSEE